MFSSKLDEILLSLSGKNDVKLYSPYSDRGAWEMVNERRAALFEARARRAINERIPPLYLSDAADIFEDGSRIFGENQLSRREQLKAIALHCLAGGGDLYQFAAMADLIYALCEEAFWGPPGAYAGLDEGVEVNEVSLLTAGLLAALKYFFDDAGFPLLKRALSYAALAVNARVLTPLIRRDALSAFAPDDPALPQAAEHALTAALILCGDDHDRWLCVRKTTTHLDKYLDAMHKDGSFRASLESHVAGAAAFTACVDLIYRACNREIEFRSEAAFRKLIDLPCALHIDGGWFVNGGSGSMRPSLSPDELYEMASFAGDRRLMGLSAALHRLTKDSAMAKFTEPTGPLLRQAHQALILHHLLKQPAAEPMNGEVRLPDLPLYAKRGRGFYAALAGTADKSEHPSVGNFVLFYDGEPVFFDADGLFATRDHTLPTVDGFGQSLSAGRGRDASIEEKGVYTILSMNIAPAYEKGADLSSWQRTVMFTPMELGVRLMEVYDFDAAEHSVAFHFITPHKPEVHPDRVLIGPVTLRWEGEFALSAERLPGEAYRLTLHKSKPARGGSDTFIITAEEKGGFNHA